MAYPVSDPSARISVPLVCSLAVSALVLSIIFIVLGALGAQGTIPMAPIGAEIMITIGVGFILGAVSSVLSSAYVDKRTAP